MRYFSLFNPRAYYTCSDTLPCIQSDSAWAIMARHLMLCVMMILLQTVFSAPLPMEYYLEDVQNDEKKEKLVHETEKGEELKKEPRFLGDWLSDTLPLAVANNEIVR